MHITSPPYLEYSGTVFDKEIYFETSGRRADPNQHLEDGGLEIRDLPHVGGQQQIPQHLYQTKQVT